MNVILLERAVLLIGGSWAVRVIARYRVEKRKQREMMTPLVDPVLLESTFVPQEGDDPNLVAEVRDTIAHINRQAWAQEFYALPDQIVKLDHNLPKAAKATLRRLMGRLIRSNDRWLVLVGANALKRLAPGEAAVEIQAEIDRLSSLSDATTADEGLKAELEKLIADDASTEQTIAGQ